MTKEYVLISPSVELSHRLRELGRLPSRIYSYLNTRSRDFKFEPTGDALVVDWASREKQVRGFTTLLTRGITMAMQAVLARGAPVSYLARLSAPRHGWQSPLNGWSPLVTHHCLCGYSTEPDTPHVQLRAFTSGVLVHSVFCRHVDSTVSLTADETARRMTQLTAAWIAKWLDVSPAGEDEPLRNSHVSRESRQAEPIGPQQPPDSGGTDSYHDEQKVFPTDAEAREKERRKALQASGKAHVVNKANCPSRRAL